MHLKFTIGILIIKTHASASVLLITDIWNTCDGLVVSLQCVTRVSATPVRAGARVTRRRTIRPTLARVRITTAASTANCVRPRLKTLLSSTC